MFVLIFLFGLLFKVIITFFSYPISKLKFSIYYDFVSTSYAILWLKVRWNFGR